MPVAVSYPGVYVEEIPSGVRTITGVATSIAAFAGWAPKGSIEAAGLVTSWQDFYRQYGGLDARGLLGYAVSHFFANGGQQAYIVRVVTSGSATATDNAASAAVTLDGVLTISASNPGKWGEDYAIVTKKRTDDQTRFMLSVANVSLDKKGVVVESFENMSMDETDKRYVVNVLKNESTLMRATVVGGATNPPGDTQIPASGEIPTSAYLQNGADGKVLAPNDPAFETALFQAPDSGALAQLDRVDLFNLLCVPGETTPDFLDGLEAYCRSRRAILIADCDQTADFTKLRNGPNPSLTKDEAINAAFYFPWVKAPDPLQENRLRDFPPCGFVAGLYARTDANRGVWKAPAGIDASLSGAGGVTWTLTDIENGILNKQAINCIRNFPIYGTVIWGTRTLRGNDEIGSEWKYIPVRRTALFIEESLYRALKWVVFEPNDEPLWAQIRLNVGAFMQNLFRQGAFQGKTPQEAYFVKCDKDTTPQNQIDLGIVNIIVGFAPLKPAEFVIIQLQQMAGQIAT